MVKYESGSEWRRLVGTFLGPKARKSIPKMGASVEYRGYHTELNTCPNVTTGCRV